ncbi:SHOCT domain-containing protein [Hymenobacter sp. BT559]|uniref:SHOCT domain-containing protein n=1 Tax=Hymenobacter sp. BT559 TaxID=2795729 RepID=UPI0018EC1562|nr:SHOCT domain-containing protein [Hymenobacter sp. BT559]MBJ6144567.1 SHOCT domain-containing protein [Hymenobacter sp. BT559]
MNPSDANSALATLRQLKEMLDAGTLTPQEFEALKQKLVFGQEARPAPDSAPTPALGPPLSSPVPAAEPIASAQVELPPASATPQGTDWLTAAAPVLIEDTPANPSIEAPEERRNPLTLVFIIGGALVLLATVLYLTLGSSAPDEHLTSTSQTAADSARVTPEVGPQAEQLTLPLAVPETIRVAPVVVPAPVAKPAATQFQADSSAASATTSPTVAPAKPVTKPVPATTIAADTAI